jgi:hypothetical protein
MSQADDFSITNAAVHHVLVAAREVIGKKQLNECLIKADLPRLIQALPPDDMGDTMKASEYALLTRTIGAEYQEDGPDILRRIGRSAFLSAIEENSFSLNLVRRFLSYLPVDQQIDLILQTLAEAQKKINPHSNVWVEDQNGMHTFVDGFCIECFGRSEAQPACFLWAGFLSEAIRWLIGPGFDVIEKDCSGRGDGFCRFVVEGSGIGPKPII